MISRNEHYAVVEEQLLATLDALRGAMSSDEVQEVRSFVHHGEYGVALETLCAILIESGTAVPAAVADEILALGTRMGISTGHVPVRTRGEATMSEQVINGYIIVNPKTVTSSYRGVDREPWGGIGDAFYAGRLPEQLRQVWNDMRPRDLWWPTCSREMLEKFESFLKQRGIPYEVLAVRSNYLSAARGERTVVTPEHLFLGFDVVGVGQWSLLRALLESPAHRSLAGLVNDAGLLADVERREFIAATYADATGRNEVEPLGEADPRSPIDVVSVFQLVRQ